MSAKRIEGQYTASIGKPGTVFSYTLHLPDGYTSAEEWALLVTHDGLNESEVHAMEALAQTGEAPPCILLGIAPGNLPATLPGGFDRGMRMGTYDLFDRAYADFVVDELIPALVRKHTLPLSPSPDLHMVSGGSSGGISAFTMAWYRTEFFHRVYMSSPSFLSMGKGNEMTALMRKYETKPLRIYMEYSEEEPNDYFGSSYCAALECKMALEFAGYDLFCRYFPGEGHCSRYRQNNEETLAEGFRFLWKDWNTKPIAAPRSSPRVAEMPGAGSAWEKTDLPFPEKRGAVSDGSASAPGAYIADGSRILFREANGSERVVAQGFGDISALCLASDRWRLYVGDRLRGCVYALAILENGDLSARYLHAALHLETDFTIPGAVDLCVDERDRVYAATECGIQAIRSFGLIDAVFPLPGHLMPLQIALHDGSFYAKTTDGIFRRAWKIGPPSEDNGPTEPKYSSYYDTCSESGLL